MATPAPIIVLVHGAWHTPPNYEDYTKALQKQGFKVHVPHLPSCNVGLFPAASFSDDVAAVRNVVQPLVEAGERILMVMHSYGGAIGTDAIEGLTRTERRIEGSPGGVIHLLYMCAYILQPGESIFGIFEEAGVAHLWPQFVQNFDDGSTFPIDPVQLFLGGVEQSIVDKALLHLVHHPMSAFRTKTKGSAWKKAPVTYILTQQDASVPRIYQDIMLKKVKEQGILMKIEDYDTSHSIFITKQDKMVRAVLEAAEDSRNHL